MARHPVSPSRKGTPIPYIEPHACTRHRRLIIVPHVIKERARQTQRQAVSRPRGHPFPPASILRLESELSRSPLRRLSLTKRSRRFCALFDDHPVEPPSAEPTRHFRSLAVLLGPGRLARVKIEPGLQPGNFCFLITALGMQAAQPKNCKLAHLPSGVTDHSMEYRAESCNQRANISRAKPADFTCYSWDSRSQGVGKSRHRCRDLYTMRTIAEWQTTTGRAMVPSADGTSACANPLCL